MLDPIILLCLLLCICGLAIAAKALQSLSRLPTPPSAELRGTLDPPEAGPRQPQAAPPAISQAPTPQSFGGRGPAGGGTPAESAEVARIVETIRTMELSHVDGLALIGQRLDSLEESVARVQTDFTERLIALERRSEQPPANPQPQPAENPAEPPRQNSQNPDETFRLSEKPPGQPFV